VTDAEHKALVEVLTMIEVGKPDTARMMLREVIRRAGYPYPKAVDIFAQTKPAKTRP
jgi:hypothetical protein